MNGIKIIGVGSYLPDQEVTNDRFAEFLDTSDEWIYTRTGIKSRRIANQETAVYMAEMAAQSAVKDADVNIEDIDMIIVATITPDEYTPSIACRVQAKINNKVAICMDINCACSGYVYALDIAQKYLASGDANTVLIVSTEKLSSILDYEDRATCVLFGDGAAATVVVKKDGLYGGFLGASGLGGDCLVAKRAQASNPFNNLTEDTHRGYLTMQGKEVYKFAIKTMPYAIIEACRKAGISPQNLDLIIPHQANIRIITTAMKELGISMEKACVNMQNMGNTSSASIPLAIDQINKEGRLKQGMKVALVGFGAGLTFGANVFEW